MDIVADANLALLQQTFGQHGTIRRIPGREIRAADVRDADVLLLRSVTRANRKLLKGSRVKFVGTATIGTDHLDIPYLGEHDITWASAPGCNADAAAQYSLAMAWLAGKRTGRDLRNLTVGIIGKGNVGSRLQNLLKALAIPSVACDPPLADAGEAGLVDLPTALNQPVVSIHVPLTREGAYPTFHMLDANKLACLPDGAILVNSARGDVIVGDALLSELESGRLSAALDVWPGEPSVSPRLLDNTLVSSPHVAGYSIQGKQHGTLMMYRAFCRWAGLTAETIASGPSVYPLHTLHPGDDAVSQLLESSCGVADDDRAMRAALEGSPEHIAAEFDLLRKAYRLRNDFGAWSISGATEAQASILSSLGVTLLR